MDLLKFAPWAPSKADRAVQCGLAFKYKYVDKIKTEQKSTAARAGVAIHKALELMLAEKISADTAIARTLDIYKDLLHTEKETLYGLAENLEFFIGKVKKLNSQHKIHEQFTELKMAATPHFGSCNFFNNKGLIRGVLDLVLVLENGYLIIVDHKSGKLKELSNFIKQLDIYAVIAYANFPEIKGVQSALNFVSYDHVLWGPKRTAQQIQQVLQPWLETYLKDCTDNLENFPAKISKLCGWCDYQERCPEYHGEDRR